MALLAYSQMRIGVSLMQGGESWPQKTDPRQYHQAAMARRGVANAVNYFRNGKADIAQERAKDRF
jgi:hypothetical protein